MKCPVKQCHAPAGEDGHRCDLRKNLLMSTCQEDLIRSLTQAHKLVRKMLESMEFHRHEIRLCEFTKQAIRIGALKE